MLLQWPIVSIRVEYSGRIGSIRGNNLFPLLKSSRNVTQRASKGAKSKSLIKYATYNKRAALVVQLM